MNLKVIGIALLTVMGLAQPHDTGPVPAAQFEVASIKPNGSASPCDSSIRYLPGGRINARNVPLRSLIRSAYRVRDFQITDRQGDDEAAIETVQFHLAMKALT